MTNLGQAAPLRRKSFKIKRPDTQYLAKLGLIDRARLCELTGWTTQTALAHERRGLPCIRQGRLRLYRQLDVDAWLKNEPLPKMRLRQVVNP